MSKIEIRYIDHTDIPYKSRVCLHGTSKGGEESLKLLRRIRPDVEIIYFADTYRSGTFEGFNILSPQELADRKSDYDLILVCSCYYPEIISNLHSLGINNAVGFSWPKFYGYQFLPDDLILLDKDINFILANLHSDTDRALFKFLYEARVVGSKQVELSFKDNAWNYFIKEYEKIAMQFVSHVSHSYFDFVDISKIEYAVQAGVYDGSEAIFFIGLENLKMIYGFDPQGTSIFSEEIQSTLDESGKFLMVPKGLWKNETKADFSLNGSASFVHNVLGNSSQNTIQLNSLDNEAERLSIPCLDFLVADIENSEIPMLEGAMKLIQKDRPQLAICFYHSKEQFIGIPLMLMKQLKNYVFKIGHYSEGLDESVLYAIPEENFNKKEGEA